MFRFRNGDEAENATELHGMLIDERFDRRGGAELSREHPADLGRGIRKPRGFHAEESEKAGESRHVAEELDENAPRVFGELAPIVDEFDQQSKGGLRVRERIASRPGLGGRLLLERVTARERSKQRFKAQRIENRRLQPVK